MAIYMQYGNIKGAVTTEGFKDWIELRSLQWGVARQIGTAARGSMSREHNEPTVGELQITKVGDLSTPKLFHEAVAGKLDSKVVIKCTTTTKGKIEVFLTFELENVGLSHYALSTGGDMPVETMSLNFTKISETFNGMGPSITGTPDRVAYDLTKMHAA